MAQTGFPTKWFLALEGKKVGPFAPEQILGLLADGEIPESVRVSEEAGTEMSASDLRELYFREDRIPTALPVIQATPDIPFAPDLGQDEEKSREIQVANELATTRRLFDLFQTAREKRAARFAPSVPASSASSAPLFSIQSPLAIAAAGIIACTAAVLGIRSQGTSDQADRELAQVSQKETAAPAPVRAAPRTEVAKVITAPAMPRPKPALRNSWKPGKSIAKAIPPPAPRAEERRDEDRRDERDERNIDQWNQAPDPQNAQAQGQVPAAPLINQMANQANAVGGWDPAIQPPPGAGLGPDGQPLPVEAPMNQQNPGAPGSNDQPFNQ